MDLCRQNTLVGVRIRVRAAPMREGVVSTMIEHRRGHRSDVESVGLGTQDISERCQDVELFELGPPPPR